MLLVGKPAESEVPLTSVQPESVNPDIPIAEPEVSQELVSSDVCLTSFQSESVRPVSPVVESGASRVFVIDSDGSVFVVPIPVGSGSVNPDVPSGESVVPSQVVVEFMDVDPVNSEGFVGFLPVGDPLQIESVVLPPPVESSVPVSVDSESFILPPPVEFEDPVVDASELSDPVPLDLSHRAASSVHDSVSVLLKEESLIPLVL